MGVRAKQEYVQVIYHRYRGARRPEKQKILDEFCQVTVNNMGRPQEHPGGHRPRLPRRQRLERVDGRLERPRLDVELGQEQDGFHQVRVHVPGAGLAVHQDVEAADLPLESLQVGAHRGAPVGAHGLVDKGQPAPPM
ncbi:MAG: hypothetical protein HYV93_01760 [Candidatus Rokubacteria bacterium]|nr:hypothetical protein [Candidatus Rokubacteria bacterium]